MKNKIKLGVFLLLYFILLLSCLSFIQYTHNKDFYFFIIISFIFNVLLSISLDYKKKIIIIHIILINVFFGICVLICGNYGYWKTNGFNFLDLIKHILFYTLEYLLCANWLIPIIYRYFCLCKSEQKKKIEI